MLISKFDFFRKWRNRKWRIKEGSWFSRICDSYENPPVLYNGEELPGFPPDEIQINTTGQAGVATLREAHIFFEDCVAGFKKYGRPILQEDKLLDFGMGWGRITRFFIKNLPKKNLFGIDVTPEFVDICKTSFGTDNFQVCNPFPPTRIPDNSFSHIVGYSVFSHLSEAACRAWMKEFSRVLNPGGMIALTTRGRPFFDYCENLSRTKQTGYAAALANLFVDFDDARRRYDSGEFIHSNREGVTGGGKLNAEFYGETFIPEAYARTAFSNHFDFMEFVFEPSRQTHPIMFFRKKG